MSSLALEGALKLKEISYIHAEGYAAGELKPGPIELVDEHTPIIILAPSDAWFEKSASNMSEVMARGGKVVFITDPQWARHAPESAEVVVTVPASDSLISALMMSAPIQMLACHVAVVKATDVDQPRNPAKSVTRTMPRSPPATRAWPSDLRLTGFGRPESAPCPPSRHHIRSQAKFGRQIERAEGAGRTSSKAPIGQLQLPRKPHYDWMASDGRAKRIEDVARWGGYRRPRCRATSSFSPFLKKRLTASVKLTNSPKSF